MRPSNRSIAALLELMVVKPPTFLPPHLLAVARSMHDEGLAVIQEETWYPTAKGLMQAGRTLH
ncbi:MAG: hypothetical protein R3D67_18850 [Hyphomicrobiaceae bacterium]